MLDDTGRVMELFHKTGGTAEDISFCPEEKSGQELFLIFRNKFRNMKKAVYAQLAERKLLQPIIR